ncbi:hypothetical protein AALP_AAs68366U000100, partial [Arabis alpina]
MFYHFLFSWIWTR